MRTTVPSKLPDRAERSAPVEVVRPRFEHELAEHGFARRVRVVPARAVAVIAAVARSTRMRSEPSSASSNVYAG